MMKKLLSVFMLIVGLTLILVSCNQFIGDIKGSWIFNLSGFNLKNILELDIEKDGSKIIAKDKDGAVILEGEKVFNSIKLSGIVTGKAIVLTGVILNNQMFGTFKTENDEGEWIAKRNDGNLKIIIE